MKKELILGVLGSSRPRERDAQYTPGAESWEVCFAEREFTVYTAAYGGTMEAVSRGQRDGGGKTYGGVNPEMRKGCGRRG
jgi:predicted Rossmann-fold nucleotide-binding protein